jgi:hypothetical protein
MSTPPTNRLGQVVAVSPTYNGSSGSGITAAAGHLECIERTVHGPEVACVGAGAASRQPLARFGRGVHNGTMRVTFEGRTVEYRALANIARALAPATRRRRARFRRQLLVTS